MRVLFLSMLLAAGARAGLKTDIEFARVDGESLTLDASIPEGRGPFPAVIVVHGGGFIRGDKQTFVKPLFDPLSQAGFAWFSINYRLAPAHRFPAATSDVERAVDHVHAHAKQYKVDRRRIALMGESAGGHLVSYVGAMRLKNPVAAVVSFYGPHDFVARAERQKAVSETVAAFLGVNDLSPVSREVLRKASPIAQVRPRMPPYLLIHGTKDALVPYEQSPAMCEAMKNAGNVCEVYTVEGGPHGVGAWEKDPRQQEYKSKMVDWLKATMR